MIMVETTISIHVFSLLGLVFNPEDGGNILIQNVGWYSTDYIALYPRRQNASSQIIFKNIQFCYLSKSYRLWVRFCSYTYYKLLWIACWTNGFRNYTKSMERSPLGGGDDTLQGLLLSAYYCIPLQPPMHISINLHVKRAAKQVEVNAEYTAVGNVTACRSCGGRWSVELLSMALLWN
jgi:hypothetical protein